MTNHEGFDKKTDFTSASNGISRDKRKNNKKRGKIGKNSKAYYVVMSLILTACVATGAYSWMSFRSGDDADKFAQLSTTPDISYADEVGNSLNLALDDELLVEATPAVDEEKKSKKNKEDATKEASVEVVYPEFVAPVNGSICLEYSMEAPVFSETLQEWRTHSGIDIAAKLGDEVKCAADGVVQYVKNDPRYGTTVIVDHQSGVNTVYSNLAENVAVKSGQTVASGDVLGYVGSTAYFESLDTAHLHLEVTANNENVDPTNMFPLAK